MREEAWPYLLQVFKTEWPTAMRDQQLQQLKQGFQKLLDKCQVTQLVILPCSLLLPCSLHVSLDSSVPHSLDTSVPTALLQYH